MVTEWPPIGKIAAHSAYYVFSWYKYLIVSLVSQPPSVFGVGIFFLIAPFPDLCLLVPFFIKMMSAFLTNQEEISAHIMHYVCCHTLRTLMKKRARY